MATLPMQKIRLYIHRDHVDRVLERIQKLSIVEFREPEIDLINDKREDFDANYHASRLDFAVNFLSTYDDVGVVSKVLEGTGVHTNPSSIEKTARSLDYDPIIERIQSIEQSLNRNASEREKIDEDEKLIRKCEGLGHDLSTSLETQYTQSQLLEIKSESAALLDKTFFEHGLLYHIQRVNADAWLLTTLRRDTETVTSILADYEAEQLELPTYTGTPSEVLAVMAQRRQELDNEHNELTHEAHELTVHLPQLKMASDYMNWIKERTEARYEQGRKTDRTIVFEGWCPAREIDRLYHTIDAVTHAFEIEQLNHAETDVPPVAIENHGLLKPFESVTRLYGVPSHRDLDPTLYLSGFFFIAFGLCLTDVGYGLFLSAVTGLILLLYRTTGTIRHLLQLLLLGGLSATIAGLFFGGYFGIDMSIMPQWARSLQYFDPINAPLPFFYLTLIFGFIQVIVGLILDIVRQARTTTLADGILDNGPWLLVFAGITLYIGDAVGFLPANQLGVWVLAGAVIALLLTQGRKENSFIAKAFKGVLSLYDSINYFADVLSYSRLLALGLATSALAFSVNLIADMVNTMIPVIGPIVMVVVLVVGHIFNLVVNVLGAYIHTARLQFVEFFNKFLTGTGTNFKPFRRAERNVILSKD